MSILSPYTDIIVKVHFALSACCIISECAMVPIDSRQAVGSTRAFLLFLHRQQQNDDRPCTFNGLSQAESLPWNSIAIGHEQAMLYWTHTYSLYSIGPCRSTQLMSRAGLNGFRDDVFPWKSVIADGTFYNFGDNAKLNVSTARTEAKALIAPKSPLNLSEVGHKYGIAGHRDRDRRPKTLCNFNRVPMMP